MTEHVARVGDDGRLLAIFSVPEHARDGPAVLLLNAGLVHRAGPRRIAAKLAQHLARTGHVVARFDFSGLGDSFPATEPRPFREQAVSDVQCVMDRLQRERGVGKFALFGICDGAAHAYAAALADERVAGIFMMDGYSYATVRSRWLQLQMRLRGLDIARVRAAIRRARSRMADRSAEPGLLDRDAVPDSPWSKPARAEFAQALATLSARGAAVELLYTGTMMLDYYSYEGQFRDAFRGMPGLERVICRYVPDIDHLATPLIAQQRLISYVQAWVEGLDDARPALARPALSATSRSSP